MASLQLPKGVELVRYENGADGWSLWQLAINDTLAQPFDLHASTIELMDEHKFAAYLVKSAASLISRYGDARSPRPEPEDIGRGADADYLSMYA